MYVSSPNVAYPPLTANDAELANALQAANLPTVLIMLELMTGDAHWTGPQFRPSRTLALNDNDSGGFDAATQQEIRDAALAVMRSYRDGELAPPEAPSDREVVRLVSFSLGEQVPIEYGETMAQEAGFGAPTSTWTAQRPAAADKFSVIIVGAGLAGVAAAAKLHELGIPYTVIERNQQVGGVWYENDYPGAGVDTPSHLYSYAFAPNPSWSRYYAKQPEILRYVQNVAHDAGIVEHTQFGTEVESAVWDDSARLWTVTTTNADGERTVRVANVVVSCAGLLNLPAIPPFEGADDFMGPMFHTSRWDHSVSLSGKRVAVIGTGATAMQVVPAIADAAERVLVFQRSPQWVVPNANYLRDVPDGARLLMEQLPFYAAFYRLRLIWMFQDKLLSTLYRDPEWPHQERSVNAVNDRHREFLTQYVDEELGGRSDLRNQALPTYPPYGKRILMDNRWFQTIQRDDIQLVSDAVRGFDEYHVVTVNGDRYAVDVVVLATGFQASRMLASMEIRGRDGVSLQDSWDTDNPYAYVGSTVPGFPNLFILGGPNTNLGHGGSAIYPIECALGHVSQILVRMVEDDLRSVEVRQEVCAEYNAKVDAEHEKLIWTHPGMTTWYRNRRGRVTAMTPWRGVDFWELTRHVDLGDFEIS